MGDDGCDIGLPWGPPPSSAGGKCRVPVQPVLIQCLAITVSPLDVPPRTGRFSVAWFLSQTRIFWEESSHHVARKKSSFSISPVAQGPVEVLFCSHLIIKTISLLLSSQGLHAPDSLGPVIASLLIEIISIYYSKCPSFSQLSL